MPKTKNLKAAADPAEPHVSFDQIRSLLWSLLDATYPCTDGKWPSLIEIFPEYCIARIQLEEVYGLFRLDYTVSADGESLEFTGTPQPVEPRYVEKGTLNVIATKLVAGPDAATILAELRDKNPMFARIEAGPNSHPVIFDLTTVGRPSQHQGAMKYELAADWLGEALPSLIGKPVHVTERFDGHFEAGKQPKAIGVFIGGIGIDNGDNTKTVRAIATLWDGDFPQEVADIKANKTILGASYEINYPGDSVSRFGNVVKIAKYNFSGGAILYKAAAAHPETQMLAANKETTESLIDVMSEEVLASVQKAIASGDLLAEVITTKQRNDLPDSAFALIQKDGDRKIRRFPIHDEAHRKNAWSRLPQATNLSPEERSSVADKVMSRAKSAGDDWAKPYKKSGGKWTKTSTTTGGGTSMPKTYAGIPEDHHETVGLLIANATAPVEHKLEAAIAENVRLKAAMDDMEKDKEKETASAKAEAAKVQADLVASGNKVVELTAKLEASDGKVKQLEADFKVKADALEKYEVDGQLDAKWKELVADFGVPAEMPEDRRDLLRKLVANKEPFTGEDMKKLIAGGTGKAAGEKKSPLLSLVAGRDGQQVQAASKEELTKVWGPALFERRYN